MNNNKYNRLIERTIEFMDTVVVTGINNANQYLNCIALLQQIQAGQVILIEADASPKPGKDDGDNVG